MRRLQLIFTVFVLVLSFEGLALYEGLIARIHKNAGASIPGEDETDVVKLTFEEPKSTFHLNSAVISKYDELQSLKVSGDYRGMHPLTVLLYINYRQTDEISFQFVSEFERPTIDKQIDIVAQIYHFLLMHGEINKGLLKKIQSKIADFIAENSDEKYNDDPDAMQEAGLITEETALLIAPRLAQKSNEREQIKKAQKRQDEIEDAADELIKDIKSKYKEYSAVLTKRSTKEKNPFIVIKKKQPIDEYTSEIWTKACEKFNASELSFSLTQVDQEMSCGQCCSCFWCFLCCCPFACSKYCCQGSCACDHGAELQLAYQ